MTERPVIINQEIKADDGSTLMPVIIGEVNASKERQQQGFRPLITILLYPNVDPCVRLIFYYRDKVMHVASSVENAEDVLKTFRHVMACQESADLVADHILNSVFDTVPEPNRVMLEIVDVSANVSRH